MKIKFQLLLIISLITVTFLLGISFYAYQESNKQTIEKENRILENLRLQLFEESSFLHYFSFVPATNALLDYKEKHTITEEAFLALDAIVYLPKINPTIKEALRQIKGMSQNINERRFKLIDSAENFIAKGESVGGHRPRLRLTEFTALQMYEKKEGYSDFLVAAFEFSSQIFVMHESFITSVDLIDHQYNVIQNEIQQLQQKTLLILIIAISILAAFGYIFSLRIAKKIVNRIHKLEDATREISNGNLIQKIAIDGKDEIKELGIMMENMRLSLTDSMRAITAVSARAVESKDFLIESLDNSNKILQNLNQETNVISTVSDDLITNVQNANTEISLIIRELDTVSEMIISQAAMIEESTASITQMAASIVSLSNIMQKNKSGSEKLVSIARIGEKQLYENVLLISQINENVSTIHDMAELISNIASQTNLLAMNAAIEAAHAGDYGKGFSVVADEIRTLAEASSENTKNITHNLKQIINNIEKADFSSKEITTSFSEIQNEILNVSNNFDEILNGLQELNQGGNQIMEAMVELNTYTTSITENNTSMNNHTKRVSQSIELVRQSSKEVSQASASINKEVLNIRNTFKEVGDNAITVGSLSDDLNENASRFSIE